MNQDIFLSDITFLVPEVPDEYVGHGPLSVTDDGGPGEIHAGPVLCHVVEVQVLKVLQAGGVDLAVYIESIAGEHVGGRTAASAAIDVRACEAGAVVQVHRVVRGRAVIVAAGYFGVHRTALNRDHVARGAPECRVAASDLPLNRAAFNGNLIACGISGFCVTAVNMIFYRSAFNDNPVSGGVPGQGVAAFRSLTDISSGRNDIASGISTVSPADVDGAFHAAS